MNVWDLKKVLSMASTILHIDQLVRAEVSDFTKIMQQWQNPGIDNTMKKSLPLRNCLVDINNCIFMLCCCPQHTCEIQGILEGPLAHSTTHTELSKDAGCNAMRHHCLFH